ncbi:hypothetical protein GF369_04385 [Candidatus Peregrinibacteria bacterium]|nr:hypothetical protein [Candidatus Peregrinibacteria bacterium]
MADDNNPIIDLSEIQEEESQAALGDDILAMEDELLGTASDDSGKAAAATKATPSSTKKTKKKTKSREDNFHIPKAVRDNHPDLIPLILDTESMDDEEREYWFQILPIMTEDQVAKFKNILVTEKKQLAKLDQEYEAELAKINEKHLQEWQAFEAKQQREALEEKEQAHEAKESSTEEELLKKLQNL